MLYFPINRLVITGSYLYKCQCSVSSLCSVRSLCVVNDLEARCVVLNIRKTIDIRWVNAFRHENLGLQFSGQYTGLNHVF